MACKEAHRPDTLDLSIDWRPAISTITMPSSMKDPHKVPHLHDTARSFAAKHSKAKFSLLTLWSHTYFYPLMIGTYPIPHFLSLEFKLPLDYMLISYQAGIITTVPPSTISSAATSSGCSSPKTCPAQSGPSTKQLSIASHPQRPVRRPSRRQERPVSGDG